MSNTTTVCPDDTSLSKLMDGSLSAGAAAIVTDHLSRCERCQKACDSLNVNDEFADRMADALNEDDGLTLFDSLTKPAAPRKTAAFHDEDTLFDRLNDQDGKQEADPTPAAEFTPYADVEKWFEPSDKSGVHGILHGYEIIDFIGRGGMGVVFRGRDLSLNRTVAIKVMAPSLATNPMARERFLREARSAAAINHANVATVHAVVDNADLPSLVMEYVDGETLHDRLERVGSLKLKEIIRIGYQVASGLKAAHSKGIVHRDLKPGNILLETTTRRARLTDFGLARVTSDDSLTQSGMLVGTPGYIAPEVAEGQEADHRSDLFSLGCLLHMMATGGLPFQSGSSMDFLRRVVEDTPTRIRQIRPELPEWLDELISRLLMKDSGLRLQSAADVKRIFKQRYLELKDGSWSGEDSTAEPLSVESLVPATPTTPQSSRQLLPLSPTVVRRLFAAGGAAALLIVGAWINSLIQTDGDSDVQSVSALPVKSELSSGPDRTTNSSSNGAPRHPQAAFGKPEGVSPRAMTINVRALTTSGTHIAVPGERGKSAHRPAVTSVETGGLTSAAHQVQVSPTSPVIDTTTTLGLDDQKKQPTIARSNRPFTVLNEEGESSSFETFEEAVREADDDATITINSNGPFEVSPIEIEFDQLTIAAAPGTRPILRLANDADTNDELLTSSEHVRLLGLELRLEVPGDQDIDPESAGGCLLRTHGGAIEAQNCRFVVQSAGSIVAAEATEEMEFIDCELHAPRGTAVNWTIDDEGETSFRNCVFTAGRAVAIGGRATEARLEIIDSTLLAGSGVWLGQRHVELDEEDEGLQIRTERTVFDVDQALITLAPLFDSPLELVVHTHWSGDRNIYSGRFFAVMGRQHLEFPADAPKTVAQWATIENVKERASIRHRLQYEAPREELAEAAFVSPQVSAARFGLQDADQLEQRLGGYPGASLESVGPAAHE